MGKLDKVLIVVGALLVCAFVLVVLFLPPPGPRHYRENLSIEVTLVRGTADADGDDSEDMLVGVVRNKGDQVVTWVDATFSLLDEDGVQVAGRTELLAHSLPFGDNNTPIPPNSTKRFKCPISNVPAEWDGEVKWTITDVVLQ